MADTTKRCAACRERVLWIDVWTDGDREGHYVCLADKYQYQSSWCERCQETHAPIDGHRLGGPLAASKQEGPDDV